MFSINKKISARQLYRLMLLELFGLSTLLLPGELSRACAVDGIWAICLGALLALCYFYVLCKLDVNLHTIVTDCIYFVHFLILGSYVLYLLGNLIKTYLLQDMSQTNIALLLILVGCYQVFAGIEGRARVYELLFPVLAVLLVLLLIFAATEVDTDYWTPVFSCGAGNLFMSTYSVFCFFFLGIILWMSKEYQVKPCTFGVVRAGILTLAPLLVIVYLILLGIFQAKEMMVLKAPVITLMTIVSLPGNFLQRQDVFMIGIWFFSLMALLGSCIFYMSELLGKTGIKIKSRHWSELAAAVLIYVLFWALYRYVLGVELIAWYLRNIGVPLIGVLPFLLFVWKKLKRGGKI